MILRIEIDGDWGATDFAEFFLAISTLYYLENYREPVAIVMPGDESQQNIKTSIVTHRGESSTIDSDFVTLDPRAGFSEAFSDEFEKSLRIKRISFGSPGFTDFTGLGSALEQIRLFIQYLCERRQRINSLELDNEEKTLRIGAMRDLVRRYSEEPFNKLPNAGSAPNYLLELIAQRKITGASNPKNDV